MIALARDMEVLAEVTHLIENSNGFALLKAEAMKKIAAVEDSLTRLLFRTATEVDPLRVEYDRGFRQGVLYALEALPNELAAELRRTLKKEVDSA